VEVQPVSARATVDVAHLGALPREYLESVQATLTALHLGERSTRERAGSRRIAPVGDGEPIQFQPGLTDAECSALEEDFGLRFPPDLRSFLQFTLPLRVRQFPNWRGHAAEELAGDFASILHGICFDIEHRNFWMPAWGAKPTQLVAACAVAEEVLKAAPRLIRIFGRRYMPDTPLEAGNPVYSIHQTDIVPYGNDIADYFHHEFDVPRLSWAAVEPKEIPFWSELVRLNGG